MNAEKRCEDKKYVRAMQQTADYFGLVLTGLRQYMEELKKQDIPGVKWDE